MDKQELEAGEGLLKALQDVPHDYDRYAIYADWLRSRGHPGTAGGISDEELAYAYEWAGERHLHPYRSKKGRVCWWKRQTGKKKSPHNLPFEVFDAIRPKPNGALQCKTWENAFRQLAKVLKSLREVLALKRKKHG